MPLKRLRENSSFLLNDSRAPSGKVASNTSKTPTTHLRVKFGNKVAVSVWVNFSVPTTFREKFREKNGNTFRMSEELSVSKDKERSWLNSTVKKIKRALSACISTHFVRELSLFCC